MFQSPAQQACFEKLVKFVREDFADAVVVADGAPMVSVSSGSAVTYISVRPLGPDEAIVSVRAIVVSRAEVTPELAIFLLRANLSTMFGAFGLTLHGDVVLEHNLIGSTLSQEELLASIATVARTADGLDDEIVARWGGERAIDKIDGLARLIDFETGKAVSH